MICAQAGADGGAVWAAEITVSVVTDSTFYSASATGGDGGAIYATSGSLSVVGCDIEECSARNKGVAIFHEAVTGTAEIINTRIVRNVAMKSRALVFLSALKSVLIDGIEVSENDNKGAGLIVLSKLQKTTIANSTFERNMVRVMRVYQLYTGDFLAGAREITTTRPRTRRWTAPA